MKYPDKNVVFVAGANQGSPLADRVGELAKVVLGFNSIAMGQLKSPRILGHFLKAVQYCADN